MDILRNDELRAARLTAREVDEMGREFVIVLEMVPGGCAYREVEHRPVELGNGADGGRVVRRVAGHLVRYIHTG